MAAVAVPTKFVDLKNTHLLCSVCKNVYTEPVINVKCGHTFCRQCVARQTTHDNVTKCPVDQVTCDLSQLVINRALQSQVEDLEIYCRHGLTWCDEKNDYVVDPHVCPEIIKYGDRNTHEEACDYGVVFCPNNEAICGRLRRKDLTMHLQSCQQYSCQHKAKGCKFIGSQIAVANHCVHCGYRGLLNQANKRDDAKIEALEKSNKQLQLQVNKLTQRLDQVEKDKMLQDSRQMDFQRMLEELHRKQTELEERVNGAANSTPVRRSQSAVEMKHRTSENRKFKDYEVVWGRSGSLSPRAPRPETWEMPLQFKCIGTLRGHLDVVWDLKTSHNLLFSCGEDKLIKVWDLEDLTRGCSQTLVGHTGKVHCLATGDKFLYSGGEDLMICMWSLKERTLVEKVEKAHDHIVAAIVCTSSLLFSSSHQVIKSWCADSLAPVHTMTGLNHWVRALALSPKKDVLYSGSHNAVEIWDTSGKMKLCGTIKHKHGSVHALEVTEKYIIAGTYNQNIAVFDVQGQLEVQKLAGHVGTIMNLKASPSGRFLFSASTDSTVQLWNLEKLLPVQTLQRHEGSVNSIVIYNDLMLSGSGDCEIKVFRYFKMSPGFIPS